MSGRCDWVLEYTAAMIKYPSAVAKFAASASERPDNYDAGALLRICHDVIEDAAAKNEDPRRQMEMAILDSNAGRCTGLKQVMCFLGVLVKRGSGAKRRRYMLRNRRWTREKTVHLGRGEPRLKYALVCDCRILRALLTLCRQPQSPKRQRYFDRLRRPIRSRADLVEHMDAFVHMLGSWPRALRVTPPTEADIRLKRFPYIHTFFVRKHVLALLRRPGHAGLLRDVPMQLLRRWCADRHCVLSGIPDDATATEVEERMGVPAMMLSCWGCLFQGVQRAGPQAVALWTDPGHRQAVEAAIASFKAEHGIPPTPAMLTRLIHDPPKPAAVAAPLAVAVSRRCESTGNCDPKCPRRKAGAGRCPNAAVVNQHVTVITKGGARPLCSSCVCNVEGCTVAKRPWTGKGLFGPWCRAHQGDGRSAKRVEWQRDSETPWSLNC